MSETNATAWTRLASRVMRAVLARKDLNYAGLASLLREDGANETSRSVDGKIQRGAMRCAFFLQTLHVTGAEYPTQWVNAFQAQGDWANRASALLQAEMARRPGVDFEELARRLSAIGINISARTAEEQITDGSYPLTLLLQCAVVLWISEIERFVDRVDLQAAAEESHTQQGLGSPSHG